MDEEQAATIGQPNLGWNQVGPAGSQTEPHPKTGLQPPVPQPANTANPDNIVEHATDEPSSHPYDNKESLDSSANGEATGRKLTLLRQIIKAIRTYNSVRKKAPALTYKHRLEQIIRPLDEYNEGYGKLAAIESCDPNFLIYRKFLWLRNYVLLRYQDELVELEEDLESLDRFDYQNDDKRLISRRRDDALSGSKRKELIKTIDEKLAAYDKLLFRLQKVEAMRRPTERNQNSLYNLIHHTAGVVEMESEWSQYGPDLAAVAHDQEHGWFNGFLEDTLNRISRKFTRRVFRTREQGIVSGTELVNLLSQARLDIFLRIVVTILAAVLLLLPVFILTKLQPRNISEFERKSNLQLLVVFCFTILFSGSCSLVTKAKRQEVFAATAAYCAVLVVFLGNSSNLIA